MKNIYLLEGQEDDWRGLAIVEAKNEIEASAIAEQRLPLSSLSMSWTIPFKITKLIPEDGFIFSFEKWSDEIAKLNEYEERIKYLEELLSQYEANYQ
jgi:hypothetical protein